MKKRMTKHRAKEIVRCVNAAHIDAGLSIENYSYSYTKDEIEKAHCILFPEWKKWYREEQRKMAIVRNMMESLGKSFRDTRNQMLMHVFNGGKIK